MNNEDVVVVGVEGTHASEAALQFAAAEADRLGLTLRIVHVGPRVRDAVDTYSVLNGVSALEMKRVGELILLEAAQRVAAVYPALNVQTSLEFGALARHLVNEANSARLAVLGDETRPAMERLVTGAIVSHVAAKSAPPVVVVPSGWSNTSKRGVVVAAVKDCERSSGLVYRAMEIAAAREARLVLLHVWQMPYYYDDIIEGRVDIEMWRTRVSGLLAQRVHEERQDFPNVDVEVRVVHGAPAETIVAASDEADLLVLARRLHGFPVGHLGGVGRAVLRESRCPVEVVPPAEPPTTLADLTVEDHGAIVKEQEIAPAPAVLATSDSGH